MSGSPVHLWRDAVRRHQRVRDWPWSGIHLGSGALIGLGLVLLFPRWRTRQFWLTGFGLLVLWELIEATLRFLDANAHEAVAPFKTAVSDFAFAAESPANILGDLVIGAIGLALGRTLRTLRSKGGEHCE